MAAVPARRLGWFVAGAVALGIVVAVPVIAATRDTTPEVSTATGTSETRTAEVARRDLVSTTKLSAVVGFGTTFSIALDPTTSADTSSEDTGTANAGATGAAGAATSDAGTVTALPAVGTVIARGDSVAEVDGAPGAVLLWGARPMWRSLLYGVADGPDVAQLEENLVALGFGVGTITVDQNFDAATADAVLAWQQASGLTADGIVDPADVVFASGDVTVAGWSVEPGATASGGILTVTGVERMAQATLDADQLDLVAEGDEVPVTLESGAKVTGVVRSIDAETSASSEQSSAPGGATSAASGTSTTYTMDVTLPADAQAPVGSLVTIALESSRSTDVLTVPVKSLLALAEGGYAVERVRDGQTSLVAVTPAQYEGGFVAVTGDLADGDLVVVP